MRLTLCAVRTFEQGKTRDNERQTEEKGKKKTCCVVMCGGAGLKWHSTHLPFVSPSLCVLQMLGRTWGRRWGAFSRLCPSIVSAAWARPPRIAPTVASPSAPPITSRSTCGYTQVSTSTDTTSATPRLLFSSN